MRRPVLATAMEKAGSLAGLLLPPPVHPWSAEASATNMAMAATEGKPAGLIDENLCRAELSPADRARQTARRKAIYEEFNPQTKAGAIRAHAANTAMGNDVDASLAATPFTADTARLTSTSERTVQREAERRERRLSRNSPIADCHCIRHMDT